MEKFLKLKDLINGLHEDFEKFYEKGNKTAGTRARKAMQDAKVLAQEIRLEIQNMKNDGEDGE
jgi:hypothetical protein